jgi:MFS family permease
VSTPSAARKPGASHPHSLAVAAVAMAFIGAGTTMSSAVSRMPEIKSQIDATATQLAFALVCTGIGSILAMPLSGRLVNRFGTARVVGVFATIAAIGWSLIPLSGSVAALAAILFLTGIGVGTWDVAMNVQGSIVERARRQTLMPLWHGLFSVGAVVGALIGAGAAKWGIPLGVHLPVLAALLWAAVVLACLAFLPNPVADTVVASATGTDGEPASDGGADPLAPSVQPTRRHRTGITRTEILLGLIILSTAIGEGAANDWLAVALVDERDAPAAVGALALAGFNITMAIGRFLGAPLIARFGRVACLRTAGSIAAIGVLALCLIPSTELALIAAAAWGLGFAIVFPSGISAAGETPGRASQAIATVSTIGYGGFLLGAPMIGTLAHAVPLLDALLVVAGFAILIVILAPAARERHAAEGAVS